MVTTRPISQRRLKVLRTVCVGLAAVTLFVGPVGCVRTTIRSGRAPGPVPPGWEDRWHHSFVFGLDELPGPIPLDALCPDGWSEVDTAIDPIQSVMALLTLGIYTPTTVSVVCAEPNVRTRRREAVERDTTPHPPVR